MSDTAGPPGLNQLQRPLGPGLPMPGGDRINMPAPNRAFRRNPTLPAMERMADQPAFGGRTSGGIGDLPSPNMSFDGSRDTLMQQHGRSKAAYEQSSKALKNLDMVREALERLSDKQDMVTMNDIVGEASKLVARGIDPVALAGVLADAPQEGGGQALAGWIANHAANAARGEIALRQQNALDRHNMGTSAMHLLMAQANAKYMMGGITPAMGRQLNGQNGNGLTPPGQDMEQNPIDNQPTQASNGLGG